MGRLARFVLHHRRLVLLAWAVILIAALATTQKTVDRLSFDFSLPGQPGHETSVTVNKIYGNGGEQQPSILVLTSKDGTPLPQAAVTATFAKVGAAVPKARIVDFADTRDQSFVVAGGSVQYALAFTAIPQSFSSPESKQLEAALIANAPPGATAAITGLGELSTNGQNNGPGVLLETMLGALGALAVLAFVFASFLALVPLAIAAVSILSTFLILLGVTYLTDVSFIVQFLVSLIGLGVAIDYSLLVVTRWREERAYGLDNSSAVVASMRTAGKAVVFSGVTVAIGLAALIALPVPFLRSIGFGGMLIPLVSVIVSLTLLPAILAGIGPRVDWPRIRHEAEASRSWTRWGIWIVRRRWWAAALATAVLVILLIPVFNIKVGLASSASLAKSGPAYEALKTLEDNGVPTGILTPIEVLTDRAAAAPTVPTLQGVPGVVDAYHPLGPGSNREGTSVLIAIPDQETSTADSVQVVKDVKNAVDGQPGVIGVTGVGALQIDYLKAVYGNFPLMVGLIVLLSYILLVRAFRSVLLPLKAVVLNLISVAATFGFMVMFWQYGWGSEAIFGIKATGAITFWLPLMVFAFLFGLSMDYEVFILARMREEYDKSESTDMAVVRGLARTGRLVTSAALVLFLAFLSLASGPQTDIKLFATALGFGILLDATVVRALLVPALVSLLGRWNWYLPDWVAKVLRVPPSKAHPEPAREIALSHLVPPPRRRRGAAPAEPEPEPYAGAEPERPGTQTPTDRGAASEQSESERIRD